MKQTLSITGCWRIFFDSADDWRRPNRLRGPLGYSGTEAWKRRRKKEDKTLAQYEKSKLYDINLNDLHADPNQPRNVLYPQRS